ncbi:MAG TPA: transcriptional regulator [Candidatus Thermoplasmatota archaeon]|nr:transcriptional regulator [Candidatus Thermoplasmatota archaeon]
MATRRQRILDLLQQRPEGWSPLELAEALDADEASVLEDLRHVQRSLKRSGLALLMQPATCRACGWTGTGETPRSPGKCPACRGTWMQPPRFRVAPR